jgi:hypothetical protein
MTATGDMEITIATRAEVESSADATLAAARASSPSKRPTTPDQDE